MFLIFHSNLSYLKCLVNRMGLFYAFHRLVWLSKPSIYIRVDLVLGLPLIRFNPVHAHSYYRLLRNERSKILQLGPDLGIFLLTSTIMICTFHQELQKNLNLTHGFRYILLDLTAISSLSLKPLNFKTEMTVKKIAKKVRGQGTYCTSRGLSGSIVTT